MAQLRFADHRSREEGAECERDPEDFGGDRADAQRHRQHREREQLARAYARDMLEQPWNESTSNEHHQRDERDHFCHRDRELHTDAGSRRRGGRVQQWRDGRQQHEGEDHRDVFDNEPPDRQSSFR
jgi:hypothetical protein